MNETKNNNKRIEFCVNALDTVLRLDFSWKSEKKSENKNIRVVGQDKLSKPSACVLLIKCKCHIALGNT